MSNLLLYSSYGSGIDWTLINDVLPYNAAFSRSSMGSLYNKNGVIAYLQENQPRFDHNAVTGQSSGILIEPQRTNLNTHSVLDSTSNWPGITTDTVTAAPDGTITATALVDNSTNAEHMCFSNYWPSFTAGSTCTNSVFAKKESAKIVQVAFAAAAFSLDAYVNFDLATGVITAVGAAVTASNIKDCGNGWYRCEATAVATGSATATSQAFCLTNDNPTATRKPIYSGSGNGVRLWGAQCEIGSSSSSYVPANGSTVTRAADQLSFTIPSGVSKLRYTFDDGSTQDVSVSAGAYSVPVNLLRPHIKRIQGFPA